MNSNPTFGLPRRFSRGISRLRLCYGASLRVWEERRREQQASQDISIEHAVSEALSWIARAQEHSRSADGGVARHYCLVTGWGASYPETTGYIVPTIIREGRAREDADLLRRARRMLDWLVSIQLPGGGFQAGTVDGFPVVPVTFNTGQILLGLAAGVREFGPTYRKSMIDAADFLVRTQDSDGCWRKHPTPFAAPGEKTYETHVAWGLFEAAHVEPGRGYAEAAMKNLYWAMSHQYSNGWFANCCLTDPSNPLSHTIGYVLRGLIAGYEFSRDKIVLQKAIKTAEGVLGALRPDGFLPGRLDSQWRATVSWSCLTGTEQIASCWLLLYGETGDTRFREAAVAANRYVRRTIRLDGRLETRGAIKGSFPVSGDYLKYQYPNWACKFFIDANSLEKSVCAEQTESRPSLKALSASLAD